MFRLLFFLPLLLSACAGTYQRKIEFDPTEPIRVAVVPFAHVDMQGNIEVPDVEIAVDDISILSSGYDEFPAARLEKIVNSKLGKTGLDLISSSLVSNNLSHAGYVKNGMYDLEKLYSKSPNELCALLSCDALMYGEISEWDRSYYGIQASAAVSIRLRLVSAKTGQELFSVDAADSASRGLTKGPTGYSSLVLEPIKGLDSAIIDELAVDVVDEALRPLYVKERPEFLSTPPPAIFAAAHDSFNGRINKNSSLIVILYGSPDKTASFSLGKKILNIPMFETAEGHYIGEYFPLREDKLSEQSVEVSLSDKFGRKSSMILSGKLISLN